MSGEEPAAKPKRGKPRRPADAGAQLVKAAEAFWAALEAVEESDLEPMDRLNVLREPLEIIDNAATKMRELRLADVVGAYPDRTVPVYRISDASGLSAALVTRYAKQAGLEMRNRRGSAD
ncbi:hypothetical protein [Kitasatospora griseola]